MADDARQQKRLLVADFFFYARPPAPCFAGATELQIAMRHDIWRIPLFSLSCVWPFRRGTGRYAPHCRMPYFYKILYNAAASRYCALRKRGMMSNDSFSNDDLACAPHHQYGEMLYYFG